VKSDSFHLKCVNDKVFIIIDYKIDKFFHWSESELLQRRRMPKPLACLNKYHRQMMLFACGETSQLSTDSSTHNSESALQNAMIGSFRINKTTLGYRRKRTLSTTSSTNYNYNNHNNNTSSSLKFRSNKMPKMNSNSNRVLTFNLNGVPNKNQIESKPVVRQRTGSESILPSLRKFWEENFIDSGDHNDKQIDCKSHTVCGVSATSLPNSPQNTSKPFICKEDSVDSYYNESNLKVIEMPNKSNAFEDNDASTDYIKDTRV